MSYLDVQHDNKEIVVWERNEKGKLIKKSFPFRDYNYLFIKDNSGVPHETYYQTIYKEPLKRVHFDTRRELLDYKQSHSDTFESDVPIKNKVLIDEYANCNPNIPVNILYFDIEVDFDLEENKGYPRPDNPYGEINAVSSFHSATNTYTMFIPSSLEGKIQLSDEEFDNYPVHIVWCDTESQMLRLFASFLEEQSVDILTGWFSGGFDIPYIMARAEILFGEDRTKKMFCRDKYEATRRDFINEYGEEVWEWKLAGRHHLDLMKLYKKFQPGERKSFKLDSVCEDELNMNKIEYEDDLGTLYRTDPQKFFEYSLHDSRLLMKLDRKKKIIDLAMLMARDMCCLPPDTTGSVKIIETSFIKYCRKVGRYVLPDKHDNDREEFPGAIVYDTIEGRHGWVFTIDLGSLYPSSIMMLGLSKETMLFQCLDHYLGYIKVMSKSEDLVDLEDVRTGEIFQERACDIEELIRENGWTISGNGTIFDGTMGLLASFVQEGFNQRAEYKKKKANARDPIKKLRYDLYQNVMKLRNNSVYGILSQPSFRMYDIRLAASTTLTGQVISKWQAYKGNQLVEELDS
jgi:DNA polymerase elongation subunit (family B)